MHCRPRQFVRTAGIALALCSPVSSLIAAPLPDVVRQVLSEHPDVRTGQALLHAAQEQTYQARSNYLPTLGLDATASDSNDLLYNTPLNRTSRRTEGYVRWNVFRGLADKKGVGAAEYNQRAAGSDLEETHEQVALQVTETYLEVMRLRRLLALGEEYQADLRRLNETVRKREEVGRVPTADLDQMRASLIQAESQQSQLRGQLHGAEEQYRLLVGKEPGALSDPFIEDAAAGQGRDALNAQVLAGNRRVRAAMERASARAEEVGLANSRFYPSVDLEVRKRLQTAIDPIPVSDTRSSTQFQLTYQMPLGGANFSRRREALERKWAAEAAAESELLRARSDLGVKWAAWQEVRAIGPQLAERVTALDRVVTSFDLQFEAARRSLTDLISARADRYRAQTDMIDNRIEQIAASARVLSLLGGLKQRLLTDMPRPPLAKPAEPVPLAPPISEPAAAPAIVAEQAVAASSASAPIPGPESASETVPLPNTVPALHPQEETLKTRVAEWAAVWSANKLDAYLAFYAPNFQPADGISYHAWRSQRRQRLTKSGAIEIALRDLKIQFPAPDTARMEFVQTYRSANFKDEMNKTLVWKQTGGRWLIVREFKSN